MCPSYCSIYINIALSTNAIRDVLQKEIVAAINDIEHEDQDSADDEDSGNSWSSSFLVFETFYSFVSSIDYYQIILCDVVNCLFYPNMVIDRIEGGNIGPNALVFYH